MPKSSSHKTKLLYVMKILLENTDVERMERQADFLSSVILMNRPALRVAFKNYFKGYMDKPRRIVRKSSVMDDLYAQQLPEYVATSLSFGLWWLSEESGVREKNSRKQRSGIKKSNAPSAASTS